MFKFVEHPENSEKPIGQKSKVKFKIMSLKVKDGMDYLPELVSFCPLMSLFICHLAGNNLTMKKLDDMYCNYSIILKVVVDSLFFIMSLVGPCI